MTLLRKILTIALMSSASFTFAKGNADTIFYGGPIVTVNQKNDEVQALAVQGGKIVAVGNKDTVMKDWQSNTICPSCRTVRSNSCSHASREAFSFGKKIMPTPYSPTGGKSTPCFFISLR